jgi:hypothetical protein
MRPIWIAATGILGASLVFALYMHFAAVGARNQTTAVANHEQDAGSAEQPAVAESAQPPSPVTEQPAEQQSATANTTQPPGSGSTPVPAVDRRAAPGKPIMRRAHSSTVRESSIPRAEELRASKDQPFQQSGASSATQNEPVATQAALQPPPSPAQSDVPTPPSNAPFAKLYVNGNVLVNGHLSGETNLYAGDWVDTPEGTEATIVGENFEAVLRSGSRLGVDNSGIELTRGDVLVTTTGGTSVKTNSVSVTPETTPNAKYEVFDQTEGVRVMTYQGSVMVR